MIDVINYFKLVWLFSPWYIQALLVAALSFLVLSVIVCIREFVIDRKSKRPISRNQTVVRLERGSESFD